MPLRERAYYGLDEIQARLKLTHRELLYLVENGLLKASVRVWDVLIEAGEYDRAADGQTFRLPDRSAPFLPACSIFAPRTPTGCSAIRSP